MNRLDPKPIREVEGLVPRSEVAVSLTIFSLSSIELTSRCQFKSSPPQIPLKESPSSLVSMERPARLRCTRGREECHSRVRDGADRSRRGNPLKLWRLRLV